MCITMHIVINVVRRIDVGWPWKADLWAFISVCFFFVVFNLSCIGSGYQSLISKNIVIFWYVSSVFSNTKKREVCIFMLLYFPILLFSKYHDSSEREQIVQKRSLCQLSMCLSSVPTSCISSPQRGHCKTCASFTVIENICKRRKMQMIVH